MTLGTTLINDPAQLRSILRASVLSPFANSFKIANNLSAQADYLIGDFIDRKLTTGENALVLLLALLGNRYDSGDARHEILLNLSTELQAVITGEQSSLSANSKPINRQDALRQLRKVLANLYEDVTSVRRLVNEADLPASTIPFDGSMQNVWYNIFIEAEKHEEGIERLIAAAFIDYRDHKPLVAARQAFLSESASETPSESTLITRSRHFRLNHDPPLKTVTEIGKRYALLIGVRDYVDPGINHLPHTVSDVVALEGILTKFGYTVLTLHSAQSELHLQPTQANIWAGLAHLLADMQPNDLLWFYFGGHGEVWEGQAYLLASDTRQSTLKRTGIALDELHAELERTKVQARILILDACHSGIGRGGGIMDPEFERHIYLQASGCAILAACRKHQKAYEHKVSPHGVFTYFILQGLEGAASADQKHITFQNLNNYVTDQVKRWALQNGVQQTPNTFTQLEGDPLLIVLPSDIGIEKN